MTYARNKRILVWLGICLLVFAGGFVYSFSRLASNSNGTKLQGWIVGKLNGRLANPHNSMPKTGEGIMQKESLEGEAQQGATITATTLIITRVRYACGHEEVSREIAPPEMRGLSREELEQETKGWRVERFTSREVVLTQDRPGMAPQCSKSMFLGVKDGFVAVFHGTPEAKCKVKSITRIPVKALPPREIADLRRGIPVKSQDELLKVLEGLASFQGS